MTQWQAWASDHSGTETKMLFPTKKQAHAYLEKWIKRMAIRTRGNAFEFLVTKLTY